MKANNMTEQIFDLDKEENYKEQFLAANIEHTTENEELGLKAGDIIEFWGGYDNDIRFRSTIHGFDENGKAYVNWDCYWFAIDLTDQDQRDFKKVL